MGTIDFSPRMSALQLVCGLVAVAATHMAYTFVLDRARVVSHSAVAPSDLLLFALPVIVVFVGYFFLL